MKGFTIQHSIDLLEKKVDQGFKSGSGSADNITYDNTSSGLSGTNVQTAIDEIVSDIGNIESKVISAGTPIAETVTNMNAVNAEHTFANSGLAIIACTNSGSSDSYVQATLNDVVGIYITMASAYNTTQSVLVNAGDKLKITALNSGSAIMAITVIPLTLTAPPTNNTRKRKK